MCLKMLQFCEFIVRHLSLYWNTDVRQINGADFKIIYTFSCSFSNSSDDQPTNFKTIFSTLEGYDDYLLFLVRNFRYTRQSFFRDTLHVLASGFCDHSPIPHRGISSMFFCPLLTLILIVLWKCLLRIVACHWFLCRQGRLLALNVHLIGPS